MANRIQQYEPKFFDDVQKLVHEFHKTYLQGYYNQLDHDHLIKTIHANTNSENFYIAVVDEKCVGILAGIEIPNKLSDERIFQEFFWYATPKYGVWGINLIQHVEKDLKRRGFSSIIMSVIESAKSDKIKKMYTRMNYRMIESHYVRSL